jgi:RIO-like serine/threonine protein kinase
LLADQSHPELYLNLRVPLSIILGKAFVKFDRISVSRLKEVFCVRNLRQKCNKESSKRLERAIVNRYIKFIEHLNKVTGVVVPVLYGVIQEPIVSGSCVTGNLLMAYASFERS